MKTGNYNEHSSTMFPGIRYIYIYHYVYTLISEQIIYSFFIR